jgi:hypothetical protein
MQFISWNKIDNLFNVFIYSILVFSSSNFVLKYSFMEMAMSNSDVFIRFNFLKR